jgi:hypothetical protein
MTSKTYWLSYIVAVFLNAWIIEVFTDNIILAIFLVVFSLVIYRHLTFNRGNRLLLTVLISVAVIVQFAYSEGFIKADIGYNEQVRGEKRILYYAEDPLFSKINLPIAYWIELRNESFIAERFTDNFFRLSDPNYYFFANHPKERVGIKETEKFPYAYIFPFAAGLLYLANKKNYLFLSIFLLTIIYSSLLQEKEIGNFILFPFFASVCAYGLFNLTLPMKNNKLVLILIILAMLIVYLQTLAVAYL